jgi:hypothetical protein
MLALVACNNPDNEYKAAKEAGSIEAFTTFIDKYPEHNLVTDAKKEIERLRYTILLKNLNIESLLEYIKSFPDNPYIDSAKVQLIANDEYSGLALKANLFDYKDLCNFNKEMLHLQCSQTISGSFTITGCQDLMKRYGHPPILKVSIYNHSGTLKKVELNGFKSLNARTMDKKNLIPQAIGFSSPNPFGGGSNFGFAVIESGSIAYDIPDGDYIDLAFIFQHISKNDILIFNEKLIALIE